MARYTRNGDVVSVSQINAELEKIEEAFKDTLSRSGETPNQLSATLDMNGEAISNVGTDSNDPKSLVAREDVYLKGEVDSKDSAVLQEAKEYTDLTNTLGNFNALGVSDWEASLTYPIGGIARGSDGGIYSSLVQQSGNDPVTDNSDNWVLVPSTFEETGREVKNLTELKSVKAKNFTGGEVIRLAERELGAGGGGVFLWRAGDFSTEVASDPLEGVFVKADDTPTSQGVFIRQYGQSLDSKATTKPAWWGATGGEDDTAAIQACWNFPSASVYMGDSEVWNVTNLTIPNRTGFHLRGKCTIKAVDGGDSYYLVASFKHLQNIPEAQEPIRIEDGIIFDANNVKTHALVSQSWNSEFDVECKNALADGFVVSAETRDGTLFPTSSMVNNRVKFRCHQNGGAGFFVKDSARNNATDGYILSGSYSYFNGAEGVFIDAGAGWDVQVNTYANESTGLRFNGVGKGTRVHHGYIDDDTAIFVNAHLGVGLLHVDNNVLLGRVTSKGAGNTAPNGIYSHDNQYLGDGHIFHDFFSPARIMLSANDTFVTSDPFRFNNGSSTGRFKVTNAYLVQEDRYVSACFDANDKATRLENADLPSCHKGYVFRDQSLQIVNGEAFSFDFDIFALGNNSQKAGTLTIVTRRFNNAATRVEYTAQVVISSKVNGTNSWVVNLIPVVETLSEWTVPVSVSVTDNGDKTGTLTVTGEPADTDGYGRVNFIWA